MQLHTIHTGNFMLDGGAMFGVVPKSLWSRHMTADANNLCSWAMRCLLVENGDNLLQREDLDLSWPGCCWTLSQERAEWFARRPGNAAAVLKLQLDHPWEIKAFFLERNEEEIVVDCRNLEPPAVSWI